MLKAVNKLIDSGVTAETPFSEKVRLRGMNLSVLMGAKMVIASIALGFDSLSFAWNLGVMVLIMVIPVWLNYNGKIAAAKYFTVPAISLWLIQASAGFGAAMGLENYLYVVLVGMLVLETDVKWRYANVVLISLGLVFVKLYHIYGLPYYTLPGLTRIFYICNIVMPCLFIALVCITMLNDTQTEQNAILEKKKQLSDSNALRDKLFSMIAHDIKSPMHSLQVMLSALEHDLLPKEEEKKLINQLRQKTEVSGKTLTSLLDWSSLHYRQQTSGIEKKETTFDLHEVTDQLAAFYDDGFRRKHITLVNDVAIGTAIYADKDQVTFIIRNLLGNAVKFSETNGTAQITLTAIQDDDQTTIAVSDNGAGIPAKRLETLFSADKKVSTMGTAGEKGSGLGLIFCKEFVTQHGGTMNVDSSPGRGTTISFNIPHKK